MEYFLIKPNGEQTGTFSIEQIRAMLNAGYIGPDTRYWHEGIATWQPIDRIEESLQFEPPPQTETKSIPSRKIAAVLKAVPPPSTKMEVEKSIKPVVPTGPVDLKPLVPRAPQSRTEKHPPKEEVAPAASEETETPAQEVQPAAEIRSDKPRWLERILCVVAGALIVLAIDHGAEAIHYIGDALASKVTLSGDDAFALFDPSMIKSFEQAMQDSPTIAALKAQISQASDPGLLARLNIGVETERARHVNEVRQQFLQNNSAEVVDPGTYNILGYYDDNGNPVTPRDGQAVWVAISYKGHTVYALKAPELTKAGQ